MQDELPLITPFSACQYLYGFQRHLRSKSKAALIHTELWTFWPSQILRGWCPPKKLYLLYHLHQATHQVAKFPVTHPML